MEMPGPCSLFSFSFRASRSGPLCRSAASGHSERARALLAPPPFLAVRTPPPASCRPCFLSRDPSLEAPRRASGLGLAPGVPREGAGPPRSRLACHAGGGGGLGQLNGWGWSNGLGDPARGFSRLNFLSRRWLLKGTAARGHTFSRSFCSFLREETPRFLYRRDEWIWPVRLTCGVLKALSLSSVRRVSPQSRGRQGGDKKTHSWGATGLGT